ncbi:Forkhead-associated (FHA) domain protein [Metarhizium album ARSEF 1941]|uniref:Forkhead-associated (FHA) domain protein n=1 Tax=Metarhizium album (strain ARSEF 1941) TaxID=1081103 RepID=A0A0B2WQT7_METAS|nr:Forkhead-associated (FHA) domain protein [Metarhizium album ARSEF 1941]KHN98426.1 Forkhead-associated (FHA) domain protein [Metarhizium album ARSEF 1941]
MDSSPPRAAAATRNGAALPSTSSTSVSALARPSTSTSTAGTKRPAPSLLPAFEPLSSSPALPRPLKRQHTGDANLKYPTPVPTSSTGFLSSSPPRRPALVRASSERAPLSAVPAVELPENGETVGMGRSSNSSQFQLSANRLVSRVHVKARYVPAPSPLETSKIEVVCNGWNGLKLHCQGRTWELFKGDSFTSETEGTDLMVDVLDARVMIQWPKRSVVTSENLANLSDSSWDDSPPPSHMRGAPLLQSSPLRRTTRITSPESPTPMGSLSSSHRLQAMLPGAVGREERIQIYEDDEPELPEPNADDATGVHVSMRTDATASFSSELSDAEDENDPDEENDPIVHSFGPFGANLAGRLASISARSPKQPGPLHRRPHNVSSNETLSTVETPSVSSSPVKKPAVGPKVASTPTTASTSADETHDVPSSPPVAPRATKEDTPTPSIEVDPAVTNHVVNQLAFSRLSSTPLSTIMQNLPAEHRAGLTRDAVRSSIEGTRCIGIIKRQGKDAAGKALESEYYYVPEEDDDEQRRAAVVDGLRKPSLRNCRKQHKQYYWKRPKTP